MVTIIVTIPRETEIETERVNGLIIYFSYYYFFCYFVFLLNFSLNSTCVFLNKLNNFKFIDCIFIYSEINVRKNLSNLKIFKN